MKTIWKFPLFVVDYQRLEMPHGALLLSVQAQGEKEEVMLWALVESTAEKERRGIWIHGTGHEIQFPLRHGRYLGTFQLGGGALVFHVFEEAL